MYLVSLVLFFMSTELLAFTQPDISQMTNIQRATIMPPYPLFTPPQQPQQPQPLPQQQPLLQPQMQEAPPQPQQLAQPQFQTPQPQMQQQTPQNVPQPQQLPAPQFQTPQPQMQQQTPQNVPQPQQLPAPQFQTPQPQMQQQAPQGQNPAQTQGNTGSITANPPVLPDFENQEAMAVVYNQKDKNLKWVPCRGHYPKGCEVSILHGDFGMPEADYYVKVPSQYEFPAHIQTSTIHMTLVDGEFRMKYLGQKEFRLREGNFVFLPPNIPRNMRCVSKESCVMFVHFDKPSQSLLYSGKL